MAQADSPSARARAAGIAPSTVLRRLAAGMSIDEALNKGSPRRRVGAQVNNFEVVREVYKKGVNARGRRVLKHTVMRCLSCGGEKNITPGEKPGCTGCGNAKRQRMFDVHGRRLSLAEVCELYDAKPTTFLRNIAKGMGVVEAATRRKRTKKAQIVRTE